MRWRLFWTIRRCTSTSAGGPPSVSELRARYARHVAGAGPDGGEVWLNWVVRRRDGLQAVGTVQATISSDEDRESRGCGLGHRHHLARVRLRA